jgi:hypothetical protein
MVCSESAIAVCHFDSFSVSRSLTFIRPKMSVPNLMIPRENTARKMKRFLLPAGVALQRTSMSVCSGTHNESGFVVDEPFCYYPAALVWCPDGLSLMLPSPPHQQRPQTTMSRQSSKRAFLRDDMVMVGGAERNASSTPSSIRNQTLLPTHPQPLRLFPAPIGRRVDSGSGRRVDGGSGCADKTRGWN